MFLENKSYLFYQLISMAFQKIFHFNTSTNQQLENFLCVTESSPQKGFHLAQYSPKRLPLSSVGKIYSSATCMPKVYNLRKLCAERQKRHLNTSLNHKHLAMKVMYLHTAD